uniref:Uncharacterized protein n=1 Tax=Myotis myotis TaxID=51298 RepID=A0A7J7UPI7_MYOMY|nr:hypothetical protein mMyoMyo1_008596 [Myotis myotis]
MTSHGCSGEMVPHVHRTSRAPLLLQGMAMSTECRGESVIHRAGVGGLVEHQESRLPEGCLDLADEGLGVKCPAIAVAPVNFSTASWTVWHGHQLGFQWQQWQKLPAEASPRFSSSFCRWTVPFGSQGLLPPEWVPAARNLRTSSSFLCRTSGTPDIVEVSL